MKDYFDHIPVRIAPLITMRALNEPVSIMSGRFPLRVDGSHVGVLEGQLRFRWVPSTAVEFEGTFVGYFPHQSTDGFELTIPEFGLDAPVLVTSVSWDDKVSYMRGVLQRSIEAGHADAMLDRILFQLVNFPEYDGSAIRFEINGGLGFCRGRLGLASGGLLCTVDEIPEVKELRKTARQDSGYVMTHTGELTNPIGPIALASVKDVLALLYSFFGFLRGAWAGPVFPKGYSKNDLVWEQFAAWIVDETRQVPTWIPQRNPIDVNDLFAGFAQKWGNAEWKDPLRSVIAWYVIANSSQLPHEMRIVTAQIALELLAWVELVETGAWHTRYDFNRLSAAGKVRSLLHHLSIPIGIPGHFSELHSLCEPDSPDGPGVVSRLRNSLVHATENSRAFLSALSGTQVYQGGQLAIQYLELSLLRLCGYRGKYARRAWVGWKGEDEVLVPWQGAG